MDPVKKNGNPPTAQEALERSEHQYRMLFEEMLGGFALHEIICDKKGLPIDYRFLAVNPAFEAMTGLRATDIVGRTALEVLPGLESFWIRSYGQVALTREPIQFENFTNTLGRQFEVRAYSPEPGKFATIFHDVTERVEAEKALQESEERHRTILEKMLEGLMLVEIESMKIFYVNPAMCAMLGYSAEALTKLKISQIHPVEHWPRVLEEFRKLARREETLAAAIPCLRRDKTIFYADIRSTVVNFEGEAYNMGIFSDITERLQAEALLKKSLQEKDLLLAEIHHRVKNNMQIIGALLQLQKAQIDNSEMRALLDAASNRILSMAMVHERLYQTHDFSAIDVREYIRDLVGRLFEGFGIAGQETRVDIKADNIKVSIKVMIPLGLILNELITNSLKHALKPGTPGVIAIAIHEQAGGYVMEYSDNGPGIAVELDLDNIKTLGMNLVRNLAKQIGGGMEILRGEKTVIRIRFGKGDAEWQKSGS